MAEYEKSIELMNEFFNIEQSENFSNEIFQTLQKIINFDSGYIFYTNPTRLEYSYNPKTNDINNIQENYLVENLKIKNTIFGKIIITGNHFSDTDKKVFRTCASIIANITKDKEISKIIKMQIQALQEGYEKVQKSNKKILESEKIKTKFISHISHELRTPLNSILGFSDLLGNEYIGKLNEKQKEYINDIKISGLHLLGMINEILDMSKIEAGAIKLTLREFEIKQAINEVINIINPLLIKKHQTLETYIEEFKIKADYQKIQQILFNLLSNAIKYTPENGKIKISTSKKDNSAIIQIEDNGIGIATKNHKKIFKKFEQIGEAQANSTGLGLSITKELIKLHKGKIAINSELDKGSIFKITLPQ